MKKLIFISIFILLFVGGSSSSADEFMKLRTDKILFYSNIITNIQKNYALKEKIIPPEIEAEIVELRYAIHMTALIMELKQKNLLPNLKETSDEKD